MLFIVEIVETTFSNDFSWYIDTFLSPIYTFPNRANFIESSY